MLNKKLITTIFIFSILLFSISKIKNKTRILEKNISELKLNISKLNTDLHESLLDYNYLSSPKSLTEKIQFLSSEKYDYMPYSKIYLGYENFIHNQKKITKKINE